MHLIAPRAGELLGLCAVSFFAPHQAYSSRQDPLGPIDEFRDMVKGAAPSGNRSHSRCRFQSHGRREPQRADLCFRGIDNDAYYIFEAGGVRYANYTGCGNTLNANHPVVRRMILDSLRYWVEEMHVDGFRFDLASILSRDETGEPLPNPPVLWDIESDPVLASTKLIAEAWDAAGLYQVGSFVGDAGRSGMGSFATTCADFFRGEQGTVRCIADRHGRQSGNLWS